MRGSVLSGGACCLVGVGGVGREWGCLLGELGLHEVECVPQVSGQMGCRCLQRAPRVIVCSVAVRGGEVCVPETGLLLASRFIVKPQR